jgi:hypothetical protein
MHVFSSILTCTKLNGTSCFSIQHR